MPLKGLFRGGDEGGRSDGSGSGSARGERTGSGSLGKPDKLMTKMARALLPNAGKRDRLSDRPYFNPEDHISEKREWARRYTQQHGGRSSTDGGSGAGSGGSQAGALERLFEHFAVVGLPPTTNIRAVAADIKTYQKLSRESGGFGAGGLAAAGGMEVTADTPREEKQRQYGLKGPALQAEVLYTHPGPALPADLERNLAAFCFPHGVRPELLERTPSMSALNEVIYSQPYQTHDDHSFVFLMKVAVPGSVAPRTLYGVCCYVRELVHRPPSMAKEAYPGCNAPLSRYLVVAPRCYCLLTHYPFFSLHFRVLQTILGLERLERMTSFAAELAGLADISVGGSSSQLSPPGSSLPANSADGGATSPTQSQSQSCASLARQPGGTAAERDQEASSHDGSALGLAAAAAAGDAAAAAAAADDAGSESSSRRWTEGSGGTAAEEQQLIQVQQQQAQQAVQQQAVPVRRPSRLSQVSPHCPELEPEHDPEPAGSSPAAAGQAGEAATPEDRYVAAGDAAADSVAATPFFTPAGANGVLDSPGSRSITQLRQQQAAAAAAEGEEAGGAAGAAAGPGMLRATSIRRTLEESLAAVDSRQPSATSDGQQAGQLEAAGAAGGEEEADGAASGAGSRPGSRLSGSRPGSRRQLQDAEDGSSDAESYLTATSNAPLLQQLSSLLLEAAGGGGGSGGGGDAGAAMHARSVSGTSLAGFGTAVSSPDPTGGRAGAAGWQAAEEAAGCSEGEVEQQQAPLLDLDAEPQQQQQVPPLLDLQAEGEGLETPAKQQQGTAAAPAAMAGSAVEVQISSFCYTSSPSPAAAAAITALTATPPRADLLTGTPLLSRSGRFQQQQALVAAAGEQSPSLLQSRTGSGASLPAGEFGVQQQEVEQQQQQQQVAQQEGDGQQQQQQQQEQQAHEVVRVTATNLDMSRPLRASDLLAVYHASIVPRPGQVFEFQPDPGLQTIAFERPDLAEAARELGLRPNATCLPDIDAAQNLGGWAVAALCRSMSLDNIITFLTAALLERQIVVFCPNAGLLSGIVLSLVPLLLPFHWQCLLLPVLPAAEGRLELMEAPVPFVLGVLYKTPEVRAKCGGLVRVNVYKDKVVNAGQLPPLPQQQALHEALAGTYAELRKIGLTRTATTRPVHMISDAQQVLAECFLSTLQKYLKGLMADLRAYCITDVSASMERTSVLLKDSFVDSFPPRDRPFMRQFAETQMFAVYTDAVLG